MQEYIAHRPHLQGPLKVALRAAVAAVWVQAAVMAVGMQVAAAAAGVQAAVSAVRVPAGLNAVICSGGWQPAGPDAVTRQLHWLLLCCQHCGTCWHEQNPLHCHCLGDLAGCLLSRNVPPVLDGHAT